MSRMALIDRPEEVPEEAHIHLPAPSIWPVTLAAGITLLAFGVLTNIVFLLSGVAVMIIGIAGWIGDMRHG